MGNYLNVISTDPPIIVRALNLDRFLIRELPDKPVYHFVFISYFLGNSDKILQDREKFIKERPQDVLYYFCNEDITSYKLRNSGLNLVESPLEVMADLSHFNVIPNTAKKRNALMVARADAGKRMELANKIGSLLIITRVSNDRNIPYYKEMQEMFQDRMIEQVFDKDELNVYYNESRVGLCLSEAEGAQRVMMEHQLAGNPIVCTTSNGGRGRFFNQDTCLIVPPDADIVQQGMRHLMYKNLDPEFVRYQMLKKIAKYRREIIELGESILTKHGQHGFADRIAPIIEKCKCLTFYSNNLERTLSQLEAVEPSHPIEFAV